MSNLVETLDLIGHLDFGHTLPCDSVIGCDAPATHALVTRARCACPNPMHARPLCLPHVKTALDEYDRNLETPVRCLPCGTCKTLRDLVTIERIEPLK